MHFFIKVKKELSQKIEIPEGVEVDIEGRTLNVRGPEGENKRNFNFGKLNIEKNDRTITIGNKKSTKIEKKMMNTIVSHIKNMIKGVQEKFEYRLKICFNHFPITVEIKDNEAVIKNFLGEKVPRKMKIHKGVDIKIDRDIIIINSINKELAGQTAADFESATKIRKRDRRIFQDGIYIINKNNREI